MLNVDIVKILRPRTRIVTVSDLYSLREVSDQGIDTFHGNSRVKNRIDCLVGLATNNEGLSMCIGGSAMVALRPPKWTIIIS